MADLLSALREFRYLDEKRMLGALAPAEQQRWEELRAVVSPHTQPAAPAVPDPQLAQTFAEPTTQVTSVTSVTAVTEVEPPFVDAELTEETVPGVVPSLGATADSAFDRSPIPQPPAGVQPVLLEAERPATDFESTQVAQTTSVAPYTDFEPTVAGPLPLTAVAALPLTVPAPEDEPMLPGMQPVVADLQEDATVVAAAPPALEVPVAPPMAPEPTAVVLPASAPWREFSAQPPSSQEDAAEADFFKHFGSQLAPEPAAAGPLPELPADDAENLVRSWPQPQAPAPDGAPVLAPEPSPLARPSETVVAPYVPGEQRVVVHTLEGLQTRGYLSETDLTRHAILLKKQDGGEQWLNVEELKAVFFLLAPDQQPSPAQGQRVSIKLRDGRTLLGTALDPGTQAVGFYLFPEDGNSRIDRIFLYLAAIKDITPA